VVENALRNLRLRLDLLVLPPDSNLPPDSKRIRFIEEREKEKEGREEREVFD